LEAIVAYFINGFNYLLTKSYWSIIFIYWHFLLLEFPRYVLTDFVVLIRELWPIRRTVPEFAQQLLARKTMVSVIIPCHNEEHTILKTVHSLKTQSYPYLQIIVVDDGSTNKI
jgi:biofilm PGA synthesis N-glycosyltransferase PgaC